MGICPWATSPISILRTNVDLPLPGTDSTKHDGFEMIPSRNQLNGSQHISAPVIGWTPKGVPIAGAGAPATLGLKPAPRFVVVCHSCGPDTTAACPDQGPEKPRIVDLENDFSPRTGSVPPAMLN